MIGGWNGGQNERRWRISGESVGEQILPSLQQDDLSLYKAPVFQLGAAVRRIGRHQEDLIVRGCLPAQERSHLDFPHTASPRRRLT